MAENNILQFNGNTAKIVLEQLVNILDLLPPADRLDEALHIISTWSALESKAIALTYAAWSYIMEGRLWKYQYHNLEALQDELDRDYSIRKTLDQYDTLTNRQELELRGIAKHWGPDPIHALPEKIQPPWLGHNLLSALNRLSKSGSQEECIPLLEQAIEERLARHKTRKCHYIVASDVYSIIYRLEGIKQTLRQSSTSQGMW